jgi:hypothetical protein
MVVTSRGLLPLLLLLLPRMLAAQDSAPLPAAPRALLLHVDQRGSAFSDNDLFMISRSLMLSLQEREKRIAVVEPAQRVAPAAPERLTETAMSSGASAWLWVEISAGGEETRLRVRAFDIAREQAVVDQVVSRSGKLSVFDLPFEKWEDIGGLLRDTLRELANAGQQPGQGSAVVTLKALPGTRITAAGAPAVTADPDGNAQVLLRVPAEYLFVATLDGYHEETRRLFLAENAEIQFPQAPDSRWAVEASLKDFGYPGFDASWYIIPGLLWARLGLTTYIAGLTLQSDSNSMGGTGSVFSSNPLTNLVLRAGIYLTAKDQLFRLYVEPGAFLRLFHSPNAGLSVEPVSWGGAQLSIGTEIAPSRGGAFFFEYAPMVYFAKDMMLFEASLGSDNNPPGWIFMQGAAVSLLSFRIGYRWFL